MRALLPLIAIPVVVWTAMIERAASPRRPTTPITEDSAKLVARVKEREDEFFRVWRREWQITQVETADSLHDFYRDSVAARPFYVIEPSRALQCVEARGTTLRYDVSPYDLIGSLIWSEATHDFDMCLFWPNQRAAVRPDERVTIDVALPVRSRAAIREEREPLLALVDSAARRFPGDGFLAGQRVRLHLDQQQTSAAYKASQDCRAEKWWCFGLRGMVLHATRNEAESAVAYDQMLVAMPDSIRCDWDDVSELLGAGTAQRYRELTCAQRRDMNRTIWWLADPLYVESGNQRRTEQLSRRVLTELHAALEVDERIDWRMAQQGGVWRTTVNRYGWPTFIEWYGRIDWYPPACARVAAANVSTSSRVPRRALSMGGSKAPPLIQAIERNPSTGTSFSIRYCEVLANGGLDPLRAGYAGPRNHTLPAWSAITDPLASSEFDWDLSPVRVMRKQDGSDPPSYNRENAITWKMKTSMELQAGVKYWDQAWWPVESWKRDGGILVQLPSQTGFIRRQSSTFLVAGAEWDTTSIAPDHPKDAIFGVLTSEGPDTRMVAETKPATALTSTMLTPIAPGRHLLALEIAQRNPGSGSAARTRFGVNAPDHLSKLAPATLAMSDPFLLRTDASQSIPTDIDDAQLRMYGTTRLIAPGRITVFWEIYGLPASDSALMSLRIVRRDDSGTLARLGAAIGIGSTAADTVVVDWIEPRDTKSTVPRGTPTRARGLVVDLSRQTPGDYIVDVVTRSGALTATTRRSFRIDR